MTDSFLDRALKERDKLRLQLAELDRVIEVFQSHKVPTSFLPGSSEMTPLPAHASTHERKKRRGNPMTVADEVFRILVQAGRPMVRSELANMLMERGFTLPAADPAKYVGTVLWRQQDRFIHREGEGYWIKDRPVPKHP